MHKNSICLLNFSCSSPWEREEVWSTGRGGYGRERSERGEYGGVGNRDA